MVRVFARVPDASCVSVFLRPAFRCGYSRSVEVSGCLYSPSLFSYSGTALVVSFAWMVSSSPISSKSLRSIPAAIVMGHDMTRSTSVSPFPVASPLPVSPMSPSPDVLVPAKIVWSFNRCGCKNSIDTPESTIRLGQEHPIRGNT